MRFPRSPLIAGGLATLVVLVASWPLALQPNLRVLGHTEGDFATIAWGLWRVATGRMGPEFPDVRYPDGGVLVIADLPEAFAVAPVTLLAGPIAAFNLLQVLHITLAAAAAAWLARDRGAGPWGATAAGLAFGLCPVLTISTHTGNPEITPFYLVPLAALAASRIDRGLVRGLVAGAVVGLAAWCNPYVAVMAGLAALAGVPWQRTPALLRGLLGLGVATAVLGGASILALSASLSDQGSLLNKTLAPSGFSGSGWVRGLFWPEVWSAASGGAVHSCYLGLAVLALAVVGARLDRREAARWLPLALVGVLLSQGAQLFLVPPADPQDPGLLPLPMTWLAALPGLDQMRLVFRYAALASLALGLLAARVVDRLPVPGRVLAIAVVLADLVLLAPAGRVWLASHPALEAPSCRLLEGLEEGAVIDLPGTYDGRYLYAQICHGRPVAQSVHQPWGNDVRVAMQVPPPTAMQQLRELGFRWLVLHLGQQGERGQIVPELISIAERRGAVVARDDKVLVVDLHRADRAPRPRPR